MIGSLFSILLIPILPIGVAYAILRNAPGGKRFFRICLGIFIVLNFVHFTFFTARKGLSGLGDLFFFVFAFYMELLLFIVAAAVYRGSKGKNRNNEPRY
jgi:hypothetical protein